MMNIHFSSLVNVSDLWFIFFFGSQTWVNMAFWALNCSQFFSKNLSNFPTISEFFTKQQQIVISVIIWLYKNPIFTRPLRYIYLHTPDTKTRSHRSSKFVNFVEKKKHITYCTSLPVQNENIYVIYVSNTRYNLAWFFENMKLSSLFYGKLQTTGLENQSRYIFSWNRFTCLYFQPIFLNAGILPKSILWNTPFSKWINR